MERSCNVSTTAMSKTGLLVLTQPQKINSFLSIIKKQVEKVLYLEYNPNTENLCLPHTLSNVCSPPLMTKFVVTMYNQTALYAPHLDVRILLGSIKDSGLSVIKTRKTVDVVFLDHNYPSEDIDMFLKTCLSNKSQTCEIVHLSSGLGDEKGEIDVSSQNLVPIEQPYHSPEECKDYYMYNNVALGGTFDHLHTGHRVMLSEAILRCKQKLTIGVTDAVMLKRKKLAELIQPWSERVEVLQDFLFDVDPVLEYEIVRLLDGSGPVRYDPNLELLVVSQETLNSGQRIIAERIEKHLPPMKIHKIDLITIEHEFGVDHEEAKLSSSYERMKELGHRRKTPEARPELPERPYIIGLTGNIASGKSSVANHLRKLGAGVINCDEVAHRLYIPGGKCHQLVENLFGPAVLSEDGSIDRQKLSSIVFQDEEKLNALNNAVWPVIFEEVKLDIQTLYIQGHQIIVVEAALLTKAKWDLNCHEIWTCIIPEEEAVRRLMERNNLSESDAKTRLAAQPSSYSLVEKATVVFCTFWSPTFTIQQVGIAWEELHKYLNKQEPIRRIKYLSK